MVLMVSSPRSKDVSVYKLFGSDIKALRALIGSEGKAIGRESEIEETRGLEGCDARVAPDRFGSTRAGRSDLTRRQGSVRMKIVGTEAAAGAWEVMQDAGVDACGTEG